MQRRAFLATGTAGLAGLAGCVHSDSGTGTRSERDTPTSSPSETDDATATPAAADVTVEQVVLHHGYVAPSSPDSIGIRDAATQYLVASVRVDGPLPWDAFALDVGGETVSPSKPDRYYRTEWGDEQWYEQNRTAGLVAFRPTVAADGGTVRLTWPGGSHAVGGSIPDRLGLTAPEMTATFALAETATPENSPTVEVDVTNAGDHERRFLGALNRSGPYTAYAPLARLTRLVGPGETVTLTYDDDWYVPDGGGGRVGDGEADLTYYLRYPGGPDRSHDMRLVEATPSA